MCIRDSCPPDKTVSGGKYAASKQTGKKDARGDSHHTDTVPKIPGIKEQGLESLPDKEGYREGADNAQQHIAQEMCIRDSI